MKTYKPYIIVSLILLMTSIISNIFYFSLVENHRISNKIIERQKTEIDSLLKQIEIMDDTNNELRDYLEMNEGEISLYGRLYELYKKGNRKEAQELENQYFQKQ